MNRHHAPDLSAQSSGARAIPELSVVIVRFAGGAAIDHSLAALASQRGEGAVEVIVCHRAGDGATASQASRFPWAHWVEAPADASPAALRSVGVRAAAGSLVACTEDHCIPAEDWCSRVLAAHATSASVVGGAIDKALPAGDVAWALYLLDYARYMSPLPPGPAEYASDCNVSYRRVHLDAVAEVWRESFHETTVHWALAKRGVPVVLDPTIIVRQHREVRMEAYLEERVAHGRTFAHTRIQGAGSLTRLRLALLSCALPPVIVWRVWQRLRARGGAEVPSGAWRPLARAAIAWSRGELRGYLGGAR